jgi:hypothetical protein
VSIWMIHDNQQFFTTIRCLVEAWCDRRCLVALRNILRAYPMPSPLTDSWGELLTAPLNSHHVDYLIVGAFALGFHGVPRSTGDIDILVRRSPENASRIEAVLVDFSFASLGLTAADFSNADQVIQLGHPPNRVDLLTSITGVELDEAWAERVAANLHGVPVHFISRQLTRNKQATGRTQDLADLEALGAR